MKTVRIAVAFLACLSIGLLCGQVVDPSGSGVQIVSGGGGGTAFDASDYQLRVDGGFLQADATANRANSLVFSGAAVYEADTNQTMTAGAVTVITYDSEFFDTDSYHSTVSNTSRLTAPFAGYYQVHCLPTFLPHSYNDNMYLLIDGAQRRLIYTGNHGSGYDSPVISDVVHLTAGQYVECAMYASVSNSSTFGGRTGASIFLISKD